MSQGFSPVLIKCEGHTKLPLDALQDFQGNLKDLTKENYAKFKKQLLELGFSEPISVWDNDGKFYILNGHQRARTLKAMRQEGYHIPSEIPVNLVEAKDLREAKKKVLALTSQYGQITDDGLYEFASTAGITFEELNTDFRLPEIDLDKYQKSFFDNDVDEEIKERLPDNAPNICSDGDLWLLGEHKLLCGDSTLKASFDKVTDGNKVDITFTSPPYNAGKKGYEEGQSKYQNSEDNNETEWLDLMNKFTRLAIEHSQYAFINVQWLYSNKKPFIEWLSNFKEHLIQDIIWAKPTMPSINENCLNSDHEYIFVFNQENKNRKIKLGKPFQGSLSSWFEGNRSNNRDYAHIHRATFNVSLPEKFIKDFGVKSLLDPFGGTGSSLIACENTRTKCYMIELDPKYCDIIIKRWQDYTGQKAIKFEDKKPITRKASKR